MRNFIKTNLYFLFYCLNYFIKKSPEISVLMYHSIGNSEWKYNIKTSEFKNQIRYLKKYYNIVPLDGIVGYIRGEIDLPDKSIALTFDDGYKDTYEIVFPLIKENRIPISVFLTTNLEKNEKLGNLERPTWQEIKEMHQSGLVKFEIHGRNHFNLIQISQDENSLRREIIGCADDIKSATGYQSNRIAYGSGYKNASVIDFLKKNNFSAGFSINEGLIKTGDDLFNIKRTQIDGTMGFLLFKMRLTGAIDLNRKFVDYISSLIYGKTKQHN